MNSILTNLKDRLKEQSTYKGLAILLGVLGVSVDPQQVTAIASAVAAIIALIDVFRRETK
jgi:uncharacterized membrane protein